MKGRLSVLGEGGEESGKEEGNAYSFKDRRFRKIHPLEVENGPIKYGNKFGTVAKDLTSGNHSSEPADGDEDGPLLNRRRQKQMLENLEFEKDRTMFEQTWVSMVTTIFNYIKSDVRKKNRQFKIGVMTVFIVVSFLAMLKSVIDVAPIAFLKVGQDQGGAFDFTLTSDYTAKLRDGDVNAYNLTNMFMFKPEKNPKPKSLID
jgi:hypothetical protein